MHILARIHGSGSGERVTWRKPKWYVPSQSFDPKTENEKLAFHSAYEKPKLTTGDSAWTS